MVCNVKPAGFSFIALPKSQLSLAAVLKCGQSFRWHALPLAGPHHGQLGNSDASRGTCDLTYEYRLALHDRVICLRQTDNTLFYRASYSSRAVGTEVEREMETIRWLKDYFQLDVDLASLYKDWSERDSVFRGLKDRFEGIRMLRQDPWENLVSFICSSNNNISRISKMVQNLCTHFSAPLTLNDPLAHSVQPEVYYPFPPPSSLAEPSVSSKLRSLGFGYRADFLQRTAEMLITEHGSDEAAVAFLHELRNRSTQDAREELLKFMGVGRKVADCVLLMSMDKREVVPVDTHVHQIAIKHYQLRGSYTKQAMSPKLYDEVQSRLSKVWGPWAGWAHTVLFTSDLKSFETYGLPTPSPSPEKTSLKRAISSLTTVDSPTKRKKRNVLSKSESAQTPISLIDAKPEVVTLGLEAFEVTSEHPTNTTVDIVPVVASQEGSLVDRIKRRRRTAFTRSVTR